MRETTRVSIFILILYFTSISSESLIKNFERTWYKGEVMEHILDKNVFVYYQSHEGEDYATIRTIHLEYHGMNGAIHHYKCSHELKTLFHTDDYYSNRHLVLRAFSGNRVMVSQVVTHTKYGEQTSFDVVHRSIDMTTCRFNDSKYAIDYDFVVANDDIPRTNHPVVVALLKPEVVLHSDGSYDLFALHSLCDTARCRFSANADGNLDLKALSYLPKKYSRVRSSIYPTDNPDHYYVIVPDYNVDKQFNDHRPVRRYDIELLYAMPGGHVEELLSLDKQQRLLDVDYSRGYLSLCWTNNGTVNPPLTYVHCTKYTSNKQNILNVTLELHYAVRSLKIKNLSPSSLILLTEDCRHVNCTNNQTVYYLRNIQSNGLHGPVVEIDGFQSVDEGMVSEKKLELSCEDVENVCVSLLTRYCDNCKTPIVSNHTETDWIYKLQRKCLKLDELRPLSSKEFLY